MKNKLIYNLLGYSFHIYFLLKSKWGSEKNLSWTKLDINLTSRGGYIRFNLLITDRNGQTVCKSGRLFSFNKSLNKVQTI